MIHYITHDVTETISGVVAHGVNCQGVMGSGVAKAIRAKWPQVYERYHAFVAQLTKTVPPRGLLGLAQVINVGHDVIDEPNSLFVANVFTQENYGKDGKAYADINAVEHGLKQVMSFCRGADLPLYMPLIGCGLGGLSWDDQVHPMVKQLQAEYGIEVYVCTQ